MLAGTKTAPEAPTTDRKTLRHPGLQIRHQRLHAVRTAQEIHTHQSEQVQRCCFHFQFTCRFLGCAGERGEDAFVSSDGMENRHQRRNKCSLIGLNSVLKRLNKIRTHFYIFIDLLETSLESQTAVLHIQCMRRRIRRGIMHKKKSTFFFFCCSINSLNLYIIYISSSL